MAIEAGDFKTGLTVMVDNDPWQVIEFMHVKPGKGAAILKTKMKNLKTGSTQERNFNASTKFEAAIIEKKNALFTYEAGGIYNFMDQETYETYELTADQVGFNKYFILENMEIMLMFFEGQVLSVSVPDRVELTVTETTPAMKGAPTTQTKDAVTETGLSIRVPQFIEQGERVIVTTADGKYSSRA
ncbi:MAG: elongation factor P [Erysipelotrichaceae bacterium]|nr:elongation factor P [Erysipelotrichaceae bacterium]